ncbi:MAG TPA: YXWGXW repeat-containing protein [Candidatus Krumholzibacteria bacterium]|nr:YXWGXW repeat-containing protein [Candidatus Krumholzibacteria bacterium]
MKRNATSTIRAFQIAFGLALVLTAAAALVPGDAQAALRITATIGTPVQARVVVGDAPRVAVQTKPIAVRTCPAGRIERCDDRQHCRACRHEARLERREHRREHRQERVWVPGYWEQTGRRVARWVPGHWEIRLSECGR